MPEEIKDEKQDGKLQVEVGKKYTTHGGWSALVIHITATKDFFYAVHYHGEIGLESNPIMHWMETGIATSMMSLNEPPQYDMPKPADFIY